MAGVLAGKVSKKEQSSGMEGPAGEGLEIDREQGRGVRAGVILEMVERVDFIPDMLKIQNLSIPGGPGERISGRGSTEGRDSFEWPSGAGRGEKILWL